MKKCQPFIVYLLECGIKFHADSLANGKIYFVDEKLFDEKLFDDVKENDKKEEV